MFLGAWNHLLILTNPDAISKWIAKFEMFKFKIESDFDLKSERQIQSWILRIMTPLIGKQRDW